MDAPVEEARASGRGWLWILKIAVSGGLLYLLFRQVDVAQVWAVARRATISWLWVALGLQTVTVLVGAWRWGLLLKAQHIVASTFDLFKTYLVATFFNNFLPSNIGGDVIRIAHTAPACGSKTLATTVVLMDRGLGLLGLGMVAATGATIAAASSAQVGPIGPAVLWFGVFSAVLVGTLVVSLPHRLGQLLSPLRRLHQEWVEERITRLVGGLSRFRETPGALGGGVFGAVVVQILLVGFYSAIARALHVPISPAHLAVLVPLSFIVQMAPVSVNGFGVREATFGYYFTRLGLPLESAIAISLIGAVIIMVFSVSGAGVYLARHRRP